MTAGEREERLRLSGGAGAGWLATPSTLANLLLMDTNTKRVRTVAQWWQPSDAMDFPGIRRVGKDTYQYHLSGKQLDHIYVVDPATHEADVEKVSALRFAPVIEQLRAKGLHYLDTHAIKCLRLPHEAEAAARKPDFVVCGLDGCNNPEAMALVGDNKAPQDNWSKEDIGKLLGYLQIILTWQPLRAAAVGILIGGRHAQAFRLERDARREPPFRGAQTAKWDFSTPEGSRQVAGFFLDEDASGFLLRAPEGASELLGTGGTGAVYALRDQDDVVVKAAHLGRTIKKERETLAAIAAAGGPAAMNLLRLAEDDDDTNPTCMMLTPRYHPLQQPARGRAFFCHRLAGLIRPGGQLRELHRRKFVHGDVRPPNIMQMVLAARDGGGVGGRLTGRRSASNRRRDDDDPDGAGRQKADADGVRELVVSIPPGETMGIYASGGELNDDGATWSPIEATEFTDDSPAKAQGVEPGDVMIAVNGVSVEGKSLVFCTKVLGKLKPQRLSLIHI